MHLPHQRILGVLWLLLGASVTVWGLVGLRQMATDPGGGYDFLPLFFIVFVIPFGILGIVNGLGLLFRRSFARRLTVILSLALILVAIDFIVVIEIDLFRYRLMGSILLLFSLYGLWFMRSKKSKARSPA